jgi:signal transduction histidine kinase
MAKRPASKRKLAKAVSGAPELARLCVEARTELYHAGRALHDQVGPLLSVAGLLLDQLRSDVPQAADQVNEVLEHLNQGMDHVRQLSQRVSPIAAVRIGLKRALIGLADQNPGVTLSYETNITLPGPVVAALYEAATAAVDHALVTKATQIAIDVTVDVSGKNIRLEISDNGVDRLRVRQKALENTRLLAEASDIEITVTRNGPASKVSRSATAKKKSTRVVPAKSTIVSIQYASRRSAGG